MSLADRIKDDMKVAMRERDKDRLTTIRLILAAMNYAALQQIVKLLSLAPEVGISRNASLDGRGRAR